MSTNEIKLITAIITAMIFISNNKPGKKYINHLYTFGKVGGKNRRHYEVPGII